MARRPKSPPPALEAASKQFWTSWNYAPNGPSCGEQSESPKSTDTCPAPTCAARSPGQNRKVAAKIENRGQAELTGREFESPLGMKHDIPEPLDRDYRKWCEVGATLNVSFQIFDQEKTKPAMHTGVHAGSTAIESR
jgi:hypothetical protein